MERYAVVINHEEQYSLWPVAGQIPSGWRRVGQEGSKEDCLRYIEEVWTDMRPSNIRRKIEDDLRRRPR